MLTKYRELIHDRNWIDGEIDKIPTPWVWDNEREELVEVEAVTQQDRELRERLNRLIAARKAIGMLIDAVYVGKRLEQLCGYPN